MSYLVVHSFTFVHQPTLPLACCYLLSNWLHDSDNPLQSPSHLSAYEFCIKLNNEARADTRMRKERTKRVNINMYV